MGNGCTAAAASCLHFAMPHCLARRGSQSRGRRIPSPPVESASPSLARSWPRSSRHCPPPLNSSSSLLPSGCYSSAACVCSCPWSQPLAPAGVAWRPRGPPCIMPPLRLAAAQSHPARKTRRTHVPRSRSDGQHQRLPARLEWDDNQDDHRIEVIANGLPLWGGAQLAVDTTLVSALDSSGQPRRQQRSTTGAALRIARRAKERTYPELLRAERCRLVVLGIELGGRWSSEAAQFVRMLARSRARSAPHVLRSGATAAYVSRWSALLSFAAARAVAASLLSLPLGDAANVDGAALDLSDVLAETFSAPPLASRLPLWASP